MRHFFKIIRPTLLFYAFIFLLQLIFYFVSPSFYVSNPKELIVPTFIIWAFVKYFSIVVGLYCIWAIALGLWNHWNTYRKVSDKTTQLPSYSLAISQFSAMLFIIVWQIPGLLNNYPGTRDIPIAITYTILSLVFILFSIIAIKKFLQVFSFKQSFFRWGTILAAPILTTLMLLTPSQLNLEHSQTISSRDPNILLLGFDAIDGKTSSGILQKHAQKWGGVVFKQAYTPLPLTHPAWNSILTGLYPKNHQVRYFFNSPYKNEHSDQYLAKILKKRNYQTLLAFDQPETSHFDHEHGFDAAMLSTIGWEAHLQAMVLNHFIFPALWLNNRFVASLSGDRFNYANIFNYDVNRFVNTTFSKLNQNSQSAKFLAFHSCFLHTPVKLHRYELSQISQYWKLSPKDFSFRKWPASSTGYTTTPKDWINPYFLRRQSLLTFLDQLLTELGKKDYYKSSLVTLLSDHGERFVKNKEIYGGVHGVDVKTDLQINVMMGFFSQKIKSQDVISKPTSLIDVTPTVLSFLDIDLSQYQFDGLPLLDSHAIALDIPNRPIWIESMGYLDDTGEDVEFPQIGVQTLQKSLHYDPNGSVTIGKDYYERIIPKKVIKDVSEEAPET